MSKTHFSITALSLIPCLIADPALAGMSSQSTAAAAPKALTVFAEQAVMPRGPNFWHSWNRFASLRETHWLRTWKQEKPVAPLEEASALPDLAQRMAEADARPLAEGAVRLEASLEHLRDRLEPILLGSNLAEGYDVRQGHQTAVDIHEGRLSLTVTEASSAIEQAVAALLPLMDVPAWPETVPQRRDPTIPELVQRMQTAWEHYPEGNSRHLFWDAFNDLLARFGLPPEAGYQAESAILRVHGKSVLANKSMCDGLLTAMLEEVHIGGALDLGWWVSTDNQGHWQCSYVRTYRIVPNGETAVAWVDIHDPQNQLLDKETGGLNVGRMIILDSDRFTRQILELVELEKHHGTRPRESDVQRRIEMRMYHARVEEWAHLRSSQRLYKTFPGRTKGMISATELLKTLLPPETPPVDPLRKAFAFLEDHARQHHLEERQLFHAALETEALFRQLFFAPAPNYLMAAIDGALGYMGSPGHPAHQIAGTLAMGSLMKALNPTVSLAEMANDTSRIALIQSVLDAHPQTLWEWTRGLRQSA